MNLLQIDPIIISAIIVGIPTSILAIITYLYMDETRKIRKVTQEPNFSIAPTTYTLGGTFHRLLLLNSGQTAKFINVNCNWSKTEQDGEDSKKFYIVSLGSKSRAILDGIPIASIVQNNSVLIVQIKCKDAKNEDFEDKLTIDFGKLTKENQVIAYQDDSDERVVRALGSIERTLGRLKDH
jgi:hypothetical protein